jgi:hypothetical protein
VSPPPESFIVDIGSIMTMNIWKKEEQTFIICFVVCVSVYPQTKKKVRLGKKKRRRKKSIRLKMNNIHKNVCV